MLPPGSWGNSHLQQLDLQCNNGEQHGVYCQCNDGWVSSGIDPLDPTKYHWCDRHVVVPPPHGWTRPPRVLSKSAEAAITVVSCKQWLVRCVACLEYGTCSYIPIFRLEDPFLHMQYGLDSFVLLYGLYIELGPIL